MAKDEKPEKEKKAKKEKGVAAVPDGICVAQHPRHSGFVRRAKGWGGVVGLVLATFLAHGAGVPPLDAMVRGLAGGVAGYIALWAVALAVARQLVIAEVRVRYEQLAEALAAESAADSA